MPAATLCTCATKASTLSSTASGRPRKASSLMGLFSPVPEYTAADSAWHSMPMSKQKPSGVE